LVKERLLDLSQKENSLVATIVMRKWIAELIVKKRYQLQGMENKSWSLASHNRFCKADWAKKSYIFL